MHIWSEVRRNVGLRLSAVHNDSNQIVEHIIGTEDLFCMKGKAVAVDDYYYGCMVGLKEHIQVVQCYYIPIQFYLYLRQLFTELVGITVLTLSEYYSF